MSKYTTGEIAKLCNVTVRTVQYYDNRGILNPSEISDGGRRLYSEDDLNKMKIICFLKDLGLSLDSISKLLKEDNPEKVISVLIKQQEEILKEEIKDSKDKIKKIESLKKEIKYIDNFSVESISGIAYSMENKAKINKVRIVMNVVNVIMSTLQWTAFILWMLQGWWWLLIIALVLTIPYLIWIKNYYIDNVAYICPNCHTIFQPKLKEAYFARYTQTTRKLTCTSCGYHGFCVETYKKMTD